MHFNGLLCKESKIVFVTAPKDYNAAAATAEWIDMGKYDHVTFVIQTGAWAAGTAAVTLQQATSNAGTPAALAFTKMFTNDGAPTSDTLTETAVTSNTFNLDTANSIYVIEVNAAMLNVNDDYRWLNLAIASPGANADLYSVIAIATKPRYMAGAGLPSAIA